MSKTSYNKSLRKEGGGNHIFLKLFTQKATFEAEMNGVLNLNLES